MEKQYLIVERMVTKWHPVKLYDERPALFDDKCTAQVLADGLRHAGRCVRVIEFDPSCETLLAVQ